MFILIDNYDSFTYNLHDYLQEIGAEVEVYRNDAITIDDIRAKKPTGIILSPGPCSPDEAGICLPIVKELHQSTPIFGVCLGHQTIGQVFGGNIIRGEKPMHAKISTMTHLDNSPLFKNIPKAFKATRYHSLIVERKTFPDCLKETANSDDGVIQALEHKEFPAYGVQFHPESIASEHGHQLLRNFVSLAREYQT